MGLGCVMDLLPQKIQSWGWGMQKIRMRGGGETVSEVIKQDTREQDDFVKASDPPPQLTSLCWEEAETCRIKHFLQNCLC